MVIWKFFIKGILIVCNVIVFFICLLDKIIVEVVVEIENNKLSF